METIRVIMLNILAIVFVTTLLDLLLPESTMRGYVKMVMGFFVVLTLLQPVMQLAHPDNLLAGWQLSVPTISGDVTAVQGDVYEAQQRQLEQMYQEKLEEQVTSLLLLSTTLETFTVQCNVEAQCLQQIVITVTEVESMDTARIAQALSGYYGLAEEQIIIRTEEEAIHGME